MRPLTERVPKPAMPVLDVPLAVYALPALLQARPPVVVNVGYLPHVMKARLNGHLGSAVELFFEEPEPFGGGGTLRALRDRVHDPVLTLNADTLLALDLGELLAAHRAGGADATIAVRLVERDADFEIAPSGDIRLLQRSENAHVSGAVFLGAAVLSRAALDLIPEGRPIGLAETVLGPLARRGRLALHVYDGSWRDVGTPQQYLDASLDVLSGVVPAPESGFPGEVVEVEGGRAYLGRGSKVATGSIGPGAVVLEAAIVGEGARVAEAIVWPGEDVPSGTELTRCVWADGARVDAPWP